MKVKIYVEETRYHEFIMDVDASELDDKIEDFMADPASLSDYVGEKTARGGHFDYVDHFAIKDTPSE